MDGVERLMREAAADAEAIDELPQHDDAGERWEALSFGTASEGEIRALEAAAADSAGAAHRLEAYRPVDRRTRDRFLERVQQELTRPGSPSGDPDATPVWGEAAASPETPAEDSAAGGKVVPWPARRGSFSRNRWLGPAAAALAASLLWVLWPQPPIALPDYALSAESGSLTMRGEIPDVAGVLALDLDGPFEIVLRPAVAVPRPVAARVFVERPGGLTPVTLTSEVSDTGSVRLSGRFDQTLRATAEVVDLWIVVAAKGAFPELEDVDGRRRGQLLPDDRWRLLRCRLQLTPRSR